MALLGSSGFLAAVPHQTSAQRTAKRHFQCSSELRCWDQNHASVASFAPSPPSREKNSRFATSRVTTAATTATMTSAELESALEERRRLDDELSKRPLELDPAGYFIIFIDEPRGEIVAQHFRNVINDRGLACDPESGEVIPCDGSYKPRPSQEFRGRSAKQLSVEIVEREHDRGPLLTMLSHANYLGRELQKAEAALFQKWPYMQD